MIAKNLKANLLEEDAGSVERVVGNGAPEMLILRCLSVFQRYVADHPERDKLHAIDMTCLCNGGRLHIHCGGFGEVAHNLAHLLFGLHQTDAGDD